MGLIWATRADEHRLAAVSTAPAQMMYLRLADPNTAPAFAAAQTQLQDHPRGWQGIDVVSWQDTRDSTAAGLNVMRTLLLAGTTTLALLAMACLAVLVGGRMADQTRRTGLLKAVGATPGLITIMLLAEHLLVAFTATAVGLVVGPTRFTSLDVSDLDNSANIKESRPMLQLGLAWRPREPGQEDVFSSLIRDALDQPDVLTRPENAETPIEFVDDGDDCASRFLLK